MNKQLLKIIKIGGNVINDEIALTSFLKDFASIEGPKILVHGGGNKASEISVALGLEPKKFNGRRVTDSATLDVVTMVYAGLINKKITSVLQKYNCNALGLSGADVNSIKAHKRIVTDTDYGFVGDIDKVNSKFIALLLQHNITPVFCAITHDKKGQLLNTNADTIAAELAVAMSTFYNTELNFVFEFKGVLENIEDENAVIANINFEQYKQLIAANKIADGMLPKLHNCFTALQNGVAKVKIGNTSLVKNSDEICTTLSLK